VLRWLLRPSLGSVGAGLGKADHRVHELEEFGGVRGSCQGLGFVALVELAQACDGGQGGALPVSRPDRSSPRRPLTVLATGTFAIGTNAFVIGGVLAAVAPRRDQNRTPLASMFLPGCDMYNQNRVVTSQNALALNFDAHPRRGSGRAAGAGRAGQRPERLRSRAGGDRGPPVAGQVTGILVDQDVDRYGAAAEVVGLAERLRLPVALHVTPEAHDTHAYKFGDLISYQNDRKYSTAGSRKAARS
jgi:hypothetical protein